MPPLDSAQQEQGFRQQVLGFNKDDVLAYISTLAAESQRQEELYQEQLHQLQAQIEKLKSDQANARACVEKLQQELTDAEQRAALAEKQYDEMARKLSEAENRVAEAVTRIRENQQNANEWQFKCRDLERLLEEARAAEKAAPPPPAALPQPAPAAPPPPPVAAPPTAVHTDEQATVEARRILADARLTAENAEKRLARQAEEQKQRMAGNALEIVAGVQVLRSRLARVDASLDAASLDLENATAAIYQALDQTEADLTALGARLQQFGETPPAARQEPPPPQKAAARQEPPSPQKAAIRQEAPAPQKAAIRQEPPPRQKATARRGHSSRAPAAKTAVHRLRRTSRAPVSEELLAALDRLEDQ